MLKDMTNSSLQQWNALADTVEMDLPGEPSAKDDKYSGGVVAICAGGKDFPGAGILCSTAAVRTTSSMVRYIGDSTAPVLANPEIVAHPDVSSAGRAQAWVVGPGRGTDDDAIHELEKVLDRPEPVLLDADALTLLSKHPHLQELVRMRDLTVLTPHAGEADRLQEALDIPDQDRVNIAQVLARSLGCTVLLKGRTTIISDATTTHAIDAGSSWGATAGSGDVLSGIIGALLARPDEEPGQGVRAATTGVMIHSHAAYLAAQTQLGPAPTSAAKIAEMIPSAIAKLR